MAYQDTISDAQVGFISGLAKKALPDIEHVEDVDSYTFPIYGCGVREMNRGQASMLIDDLKWELREPDAIDPKLVDPNFPSIFDPPCSP